MFCMDFELVSSLVYPALAVLGLLMGSYLNAWVWRVHAGQWRWGGRSMCIYCRRQLTWYENIPLVSFVVLRGQCHTCRGVIPVSYFLTELGVALLFVGLTYWHLDILVFDQWRYLRDLVFAILLVVIFLYDLKYYEILPGVVWAGSVLALIFNYGALPYSPLSLFVGAMVGGGFFWLQYVVSKGRWIGGGDVRLGVMMGLLLGWPTILVALFISYVVGALVAAPLLFSKKKTMESAIPFGTFLAVGTFVALLWGNGIVVWYSGLLAL